MTFMRRIIYPLLLSLCLMIQPTSLKAEESIEPVIEGLCLEKVEGAKKVYSIAAEKAAFGNKRIGFFDICLIKVINLQNVRISFFKDGNITKTQVFPKAVYEVNTKRLIDDKGNVLISAE